MFQIRPARKVKDGQQRAPGCGVAVQPRVSSSASVKADQDREKEKSRNDHDLRQPAAVFHMHKEENHEQGFRDGDRQRDHGVQFRAQVNKRRASGQRGKAQQRNENADVGFHRDDMFGHQWPPPMSSARRSSKAAETGRSTQYPRSASTAR